MIETLNRKPVGARTPLAWVQPLRERFVNEARAWLGTPYHLGAMVKGAGCDCATFVLAVLQSSGMARGEQVERHVGDWFCHTAEQRYLRRMMRYASMIAEEVSEPTLDALPGDIVLTRSSNSRIYNHAGIVVKWPILIHAVDPKVALVNALADSLWCRRKVAVFDPFTKREECR